MIPKQDFSQIVANEKFADHMNSMYGRCSYSISNLKMLETLFFSKTISSLINDKSHGRYWTTIRHALHLQILITCRMFFNKKGSRDEYNIYNLRDELKDALAKDQLQELNFILNKINGDYKKSVIEYINTSALHVDADRLGSVSDGLEICYLRYMLSVIDEIHTFLYCCLKKEVAPEHSSLYVISLNYDLDFFLDIYGGDLSREDKLLSSNNIDAEIDEFYSKGCSHGHY